MDNSKICYTNYNEDNICTETEDISGCNIANINPFRYRGYFFDDETGSYYLQSRYYDASIGRFVNGDEVEIISLELNPSKCNLFCYAVNNPVNKVDYIGYDALATILDIATLVLPFLACWSPAIMILKMFKAALLALYLIRIGKAIYDIVKIKKKNKDTRSSNQLWTIYTSWLAIIVNSIQFILTVIGIKFKAFSSRVKNSVLGITLSAINKVLGTAFYGSLVIVDICNLMMGKKPKKRKLV